MLPDSRLGHYRIIGPIGRGGMGEVYAAEDTKLHRRVALKLLPRGMADDPEQRQRFEREARAVAALNHPSIVTIYSVEDAGGVPFLTMELVEGRTLRETIPPGGLLAQALLPVAIAICDAIAAAHQRGMTHRDLKPANVMVMPDGRVKILDFGIAKLREAERRPQGDSPTTQSSGGLTGYGRLLGTAAYMSPEQAEGRSVDPRSDIFSIGVTLHEMASGERPFKGDTDTAVISSILEDTPASVTDLKPGLPAGLARIIQRCLAKEPERRYKDAIDLRNDLEDTRQEIEAVAASRTSMIRPVLPAPRRFPIALAVIAGLAIVSLSVSYIVVKSQKTAAQRKAGGLVFNVDRVTRLTDSGRASMAALSADGRDVVHVRTEGGLSSLWVRQTAAASDVQLVAPALVRFDGITFSPDDNYVYYVTYPPGRGIGTLYKIPVRGGPAVRVLEDIDSAPSFTRGGDQIAFMRGEPQRGISHLMVAKSDGSGARSLAAAAGDQRFEDEAPAWSPEGKTILVLGRIGTTTIVVFAVDASDGRTVQIGRDFLWAQSLKWLPDGRSFLMDGVDNTSTMAPQLWQVSYPSGERRRLTNDLNGYRGVSVSADGRAVATVQSVTHASLWVVSADGAAEQLPNSASRMAGVAGVAWTPTGRLLFTSQGSTAPQVWISNADGSEARQLTTVDGAAVMPAPTPNGRWIYFQQADQDVNIWRMEADGSGTKKLTAKGFQVRPVVSPDTRWIYYTTVADGQNTAMKMDMDGGNVTQLGDARFMVLDVTPDGAQLVGSTWNRAESRSECALLPVAGGPLRLLGPIEGNATSSCRASGNTGFSYIALRDGHINVFTRPFAGGAARQITHFTDEEQVFAGAAFRDGRIVLSRGSTLTDIAIIGSDAGKR